MGVVGESLVGSDCIAALSERRAVNMENGGVCSRNALVA